MTIKTHLLAAAALAGAATAAAVPAYTEGHTTRATSAGDTLSPNAARPVAGSSRTLRFFDKTVSIKLTRADGTVVRKPPYPEAQPGDVLDVNSVGYTGNHRRHAARWSISAHLRCTFTTGAPDCESHVAIGGSMLIFSGAPGTLTNATGRYQGATGRVLRNREVRGGSDVVVRIHLPSRAR